MTLTYNEENNPGELKPRDLQLFLKRLRQNMSGKVRFYAVGEYGDLYSRPHYHAALFGVGVLDGDTVDKSWGLGFTHIGELNSDSAAYITGYISKKLTDKDNPALGGCHPEFARMSLRPGIGAQGVGIIAESLMQKNSCYALSTAGDVPKEVRHNGKVFPLGQYLIKKLRENVGWEPDTPLEVRKLHAVKESLLTPDDLKTRAQRRINGDLSAKARVKIQRSKRKM